MYRPKKLSAVAAAVVATAMSAFLAASPAAAASRDRTPPSAPNWGYAQGFYCLTLIVGVIESTDNVTPQKQLRYEAFDDGVSIGFLSDRGSGPWGILVLKHTGTNGITVRAIDAAGNRSAPTRTASVTGYYTPGCTPGYVGF
jgi:hypothetical protein